MKRVLVAVMFVLFLSTGAWAGWSSIVDTGDLGEIRVVQAKFTAASDGSVEDWEFSLGSQRKWYLLRAVTDPGDTPPTDDYDITILDTWANDYANSQLLNRDSSNTEKVAFGKYEPIYSPVKVSVDNNIVDGATGTVVLVFGR
jgi:hypothetical protein